MPKMELCPIYVQVRLHDIGHLHDEAPGILQERIKAKFQHISSVNVLISFA